MIEVLKQMVEALENSVDLVIEDANHAEIIYANVPTRQARVGGLKLLADEHQKAIQAGRQAIAELESQEPVAVVDGDAHNIKVRLLIGGINLKPDTKIYTHPPQRTESEPVAYINVEMRRLEFAHDYVKWDTPTTIKLDKIPLYTHLPQRTWVGLTDEEVRQMCGSVPSIKEAVREAEAKLKDKNT